MDDDQTAARLDDEHTQAGQTQPVETVRASSDDDAPGTSVRSSPGK
jgi:hypothetical protein